MSNFDPEANPILLPGEQIPPNVRRLSDAEIRRMFPKEYALLRGISTEQKQGAPLPRRRSGLGGIAV